MKKIYFLLGLLLLSHWLAGLAMATINVTTDQAALLYLRDKITLESRQILANNWSMTASVCDWIGVTCGARHRRVIAMNISNMGLTGTIPPQLGNLSFLVSLDMSRNNFHGELPQELANLRRLTLLKLGFNNLSGELPSRFGDLQKLQYFSLRNNSFTGFIPSSIYNMSNLETLLLSDNSLKGMIPKAIGNYQNLKNLIIEHNMLYGSLPVEIFNISSLEAIAFQGNSLSGSLPVNVCRHFQRLTWLDLSVNQFSGRIASTISQCTKLQLLGLADNTFDGFVPEEMGNLTVLEELWLDYNNLNGEIPLTFGRLHNLKILSLEHNKLTGSIPRNFGNLTMLVELSLDYNNLTGTIPQELGNLHELEKLYLSYNKLAGSIPVQLFNISTLQYLIITSNNLSGNLPLTMGYGLMNLEYLYLRMNQLDGVIPASISNASKLAYVSLEQNKFSGPIPNSLGDLRLLRRLLLFENNLTRESSSLELSFISHLTNCKYLQVLEISDNPLHGILPVSIGNLSTSMERLHAYHCELLGNIPEGIGNLSNLLVLFLFRNHLSGPIPVTFNDMQGIQVLDLANNQLSGSLPDNLCKLKSLYQLYIGQNQIQGSIPSCLGNVTSLREIRVGGNRLSSSIPPTLWNLNDLLFLDLSSNFLSGSLPQEIQNMTVIIDLDLSRNHIYGNIPSSIAGLQSLVNLSLAQNKLEGPIPDSISHILSLEFMDLSNNHLSGQIPTSFEALSHLMYINLSFNYLSGEIPSDGPFKNFTYKSFMFNDDLCGAQRFLVPPCNSSPIHKSNGKKIFEVIGILSGIAATMAITIAAILYLRYRRKEEVPRTIDLMPMGGPKRISYHELLQATNGYDDSNLLGMGSFGSVYRGMLLDGMLVAVKVFSLPIEVTFNNFDRECEVFRNLRHRNLIKVIGSCINLDFKALVLDYMPNGSLEKWLYSHNYFLDLMQRIRIMIDVASALQYLHYGYTTTVIHCDLKPSNILLGDDMVAHVSDFGITRFLDEENSTLHTKTLATLGYMAPEYGLEGQVSTRTDVYSFGIVVMETFSRMKPNEEMFSRDMSLKSWVEDSLPHAVTQVLDSNLLRPDDMHFTQKLEYVSMILKLALNCCKECPRDRINMQDVVVSLQKIKHQLDAL